MLLLLSGLSYTFLPITDTIVLPKPINCVLADEQNYEMGPTVVDQQAPNIKTRVAVSYGAGGRLSGDAPSFTSKTKPLRGGDD